MASAFSPWWRRFLSRACPFLFWHCPAGNDHWRWDRLCWCRQNEHGDNWHGGILHIPSGWELVRHDGGMNEDDGGEAPCRPGGNYGLCRTHPTCEMVHRRLKAAEKELKQLRG